MRDVTLALIKKEKEPTLDVDSILNEADILCSFISSSPRWTGRPCQELHQDIVSKGSESNA